jgi:hypothetical protein
MPITPGAVFAENLFFSITVNGTSFPYAVYGSIKGSVNSARSFTCSFRGREALEMCNLGSIVEVSVGRGNLTNLIDDRKFIGIIKSIEPTEEGSFIAYDYTTFLAQSQLVYYKPEDYIGQDLYFAAADACNYKGIDVSRLTRGSGIFITEDMDLFGWKTRKEFIDACFNEMKFVVNDDRHPNNTIRQWRYAIRSGKIMDFFLTDENNSIIQEDVSLSITNNNILQDDIITQIDSSRLINAITVVSSSDPTLYAQQEDAGSQKKYGVCSSFLSYPSIDKNVLENIAYLILNRFNEPTISYSVSISNQDNLDLGDIVRIDMPLLPKEVTKPIIEYEVVLSNTMNMRCKIGEPEVSVQEYIDLLSKPTDR